MALTGKTIGQLTYLQYPTNDTLIPVELSGGSYHIAFSAVNYTELTYADLYTGSQLGELTPGQYYLMTDFQTCYDQPNYNQDGSPITTGNYKTGSTEPLLLLATSTTGFSPTVYSTLYPQDKITYDITFNQTEVTNNPAKGRITERIDSNNNRADYDFRGVQFIRYNGYFCENMYDGTVSIDGSGNVTGVGTFFDSSFSVGQVMGIYTPNSSSIGSFMFYEVTSIDTSTSMTVSGLTISAVSNTNYGPSISFSNLASPFQPNVSTNFQSAEYFTFEEEGPFNNYLGNNSNYDTFLLSNNVFFGVSYINNYFAGNVVGNTFDDDMDSNTCGPYFQFNILTNDFDNNIIGPNFQFNVVECNFQFNNIGNNFRYNMIGDEDAEDFSYNTIIGPFTENFITMTNPFYNNKIGYDFNLNVIDDTFNNNTIDGSFYSNYIINNFENNNIGNSFNNNRILWTFDGNSIGTFFNGNRMYSVFENNVIGNATYNNDFGDPNNVGGTSFSNNKIGNGLYVNYFSGDTQENIIGNNCTNNNIDYNFSYNQIGSNFEYNTISNDFGFGGGNYRGNIVGNGFNNNTVGEYCYDNTFGDGCYNNILGDYFVNNKVDYNFNNVTVNNLDTGTPFQNNNINAGFSYNLTLNGGTGGNPIFYQNFSTNVMRDVSDGINYVTFLSGGTIVAQTITI